MFTFENYIFFSTIPSEVMDTYHCNIISINMFIIANRIMDMIVKDRPRVKNVMRKK